MAYDGSVWVLELRGKIWRVQENDRGLQQNLVADLRELAQSADRECGATGFVFAPDFDGRSGSLFVAHNWDDEKLGRVGGVSRLTFHARELAQLKPVFGPIASAGALQVDRVIWDDGDLLISTGDAWQPSLAQRDDDPHGKVLRIKDTDLSNGTYRYTVDAKGLRSPFAFGRRASDGLVVIGNNGVSDDMLYALQTGANYGSGMSAPTAGITPPLYHWRKSVAPTSACFYEPPPEAKRAWPSEYRGDLFVTLFGPASGPGPDQREGRAPLERGRQVLRFDLAKTCCGTIQVKEASVFLTYTGNEYEAPVDLAISPDGDMYLLTFPTNSTGPAISRIYRIRMNVRAETEEHDSR